MRKILVLEPYFGGSHKNFLQGLQRFVSGDYTLLTLPARKWKMRMQLSAPWFIDQVKGLARKDRYFDLVLCSTFVDVAVFRALASQVEGWNHRVEICTYFHENQFAYPQRFKNSNNHQFTAINFYSALLSDRIAFNSNFNRESFLAGCRKLLKTSVDMELTGIEESIREKSCILYPGIDFTEIDEIQWKMETEVPVIVWNHRWEHDKNPESFLEALQHLEKNNIDFRLIVMGQSFGRWPECFDQILKQFNKQLLHFGFAESYKEYIQLLSQGDIVVSTALHEFYGISIIEAVRAGCIPVLPNRLSYPELFDKKHLYNGLLIEKLSEAVKSKRRLSREVAKTMTDKFSWLTLKTDYATWLLSND